MLNTKRLMALGLSAELAEELVKQLGDIGGAVSADDVTVDAGDDGLDAGTVQEALQALATRVEAVEP